MVWLSHDQYKKDKARLVRKRDLVPLIATSVPVIAAFILILIMPALDFTFPSIYC